MLQSKKEISPSSSSPRSSLRNLSPPFFSPLDRDARITFPRSLHACMSVRVLAGNGERDRKRKKKTSQIIFTWSFSVPRDNSLSSNRMQPGCTLCFFAVSGRKRGEKVNREAEKRQTGRMRRRNKQCVSINPCVRVIFT